MTKGAVPTVAALAERGRADEPEVRAYLDGLGGDDLTRPVVFGGGPPLHLWRPTVHVVNHGTQQRGDAAVLTTRNGFSAGNSDDPDFAWAQTAESASSRGG